ncbi:MAG: OmpA family protein [Pseudomonadota bacterium]
MLPARLSPGLAAALFAFAIATPAAANPLEPGWTLEPEASFLRFQSTKNRATVETHGFATFDGEISPDGTARVTVMLDSIDTKVDIRNVRMRFLFFETFNHAQATVTAVIDPETLEALAETGRVETTVPFLLNLSGVEKEFSAQVIATLLTDDRVAISSSVAVPIPVAPFGLSENLSKLEQAAGGVSIVPVAALSFDLVFGRNGADEDGVEEEAVPAPALVAQPAVASPADVTPVVTAALESTGDMVMVECRSRFLALSEANSITFERNSATVGAESTGVLRQLVDTVSRCPDVRLEIAGHTDSAGSEAYNQSLSQQRAEAVAAILVREGIADTRLVANGYGEARPAFPNDTAENRSRNRRIEFTILE